MKQRGESLEKFRKEKLLSLDKEKLLEMIAERDNEIERLSALISQTMKTNVELARGLENLKKQPESIGKTSYNQKWSWVIKIIFCLKENNRPMKSQEIISYLQQYDDTLRSWHNKLKSFSANLTKAVGYSRIVQYKLKGIHGYYYLLPEWIDEMGKMKNEYLEKMNLVY